ncbi:unnamed protein product [Lactuca virosa]|uniref:Retroviral polymerase SH3-like domain-containing protein n=1 Tax=Lactuca virosa TaxID=75947 RepID=A0AAU9PJI3_9ASTR|nr:unnamed protein product [Lactuca virosa]
MDFRSINCVFLGYSTSHHGHRCYDLLSERLYITRHVRFHEQCFPYHNVPPTTSPTSTSNPYVASYPTPPPTTDDLHTTTSPPPPTTEPPTHTDTNPSSVPSTSLPRPPLLHTYQRRTKPTTTTHTDSKLPDSPPSRPCPSNLRPNPKTTTKFQATTYHTHATIETKPATFKVVHNDPKWRSTMLDECVHETPTFTTIYFLTRQATN